MPLKVVYLDDEPDVCAIFTDNFSNPDIEIKTFTNPKEAIEFINSNSPDLVFLDYRLPGTTGDQVAQQITANVPKVLVTGDLEVKTDANFIKKFPKPFPWDDLEAFIRSFQPQKKA